MKLYVVLKDFIQGLKNFEQGLELRLSEAEAKYHLLSGRVKAVETDVVVTAKTIATGVESTKSKIANVALEVGKLEAKVSKSVVANAVVANTANVAATIDGNGA